MEKLNNNIKISFFGLNKNQVEKYFDNLEKANQKEMFEIEQSMDMLITENNILQKNLESLEHELSTQRDEQDFIKYAISKAQDNIIPLISKSFEDEIMNIMEVGKKDEIEFDKKINQYKESLKSAEEIYNNILTSKKSVKALNDKIGFLQKKEIENLNISEINSELNFWDDEA